jgi:sortase A
VTGITILGYCAYQLGALRWAQTSGNRELERLLSARTPQLKPPAISGGVHLLGRLEIPRIGLSAIVFEGDDNGTLQLGIGHLPGSAMPGKTGNVVLAAHRDTFFRPLKDIEAPDVIKLTTSTGIHTYTVQSANVISPEQTSVLNPTPDSTLTLITCYPFSYIGAAPQRFIVRAVEVPVIEKPAPRVQTASAPIAKPRPVRRPAPTKIASYAPDSGPRADPPTKHRRLRALKPTNVFGKIKRLVRRPEPSEH